MNARASIRINPQRWRSSNLYLTRDQLRDQSVKTKSMAGNANVNASGSAKGRRGSLHIDASPVQAERKRSSSSEPHTSAGVIAIINALWWSD